MTAEAPESTPESVPEILAEDGADAVVAIHELTVLAWDGPSPARTGAGVSVTVGVRCSQGCSLAGQTVELLDADGAVAGRAALGEAPLEGAEALYAAVVAFTAPVEAGAVRMTARCTPADLPEPHEAAEAGFGFRVDPPADHQVRVRLVFEGAPVDRAEVWMGHYAAETDAAGEAVFHLPRGVYDCGMRKLGYAAEPMEVEVTSDLAVELPVGKGETREELEARLSAWESYPWT